MTVVKRPKRLWVRLLVGFLAEGIVPSYARKSLALGFSSFFALGVICLITLVIGSLVFPQSTYAVDITLTWDANTEPDLDGYKVFYRQEGDSYDYNHPDWAGSWTETTCTIYGLDDNTTYYFVVRAVDVEGNESGDSNEVCYQPEVALTEVIVDNGGTDTSWTGRWRVSSGSNPYGKESLYSDKVGDTYTFQATIGGPHEVSLWWTYMKSRCATVPVEIYDGAMLLDIIPVNQKTDGGQWTVLGTYVFSDLARVRIVSEDRRCSTCADAVRFVENW